MKKILLTFLFITAFSSIYAAYYTNYPLTFTQPDGSVVHCFVTGDEYSRRVYDAQNYTLVIDPETGYLAYATLEDDKLVSSGHLWGVADPVLESIVPGVDISVAQKKQKRAGFLNLEPKTKDKRHIKLKAISQTNGVAQLNNIVIYVRFADESEFSSATITSHETMLNDSSSANAISMYNYFKTVSYNQTHIVSTCYPKVNEQVISYQDSHPRSYYKPYSANNTNGYQESQLTDREHTLLRDAVNYVASQIPVNLNIDADADGYVDNICFIIKGDVDGWSDLLWPHKWALYTHNVSIHGKQVWTYNFQLESSLNNNGASVLSHEMFHSLGAPDLYHYSANSTIDPVGSWDLMCSNTVIPQSTTAYMKLKYGKWIDDIPTITTAGSYTLNDIWSATNNCYKIVSPSSTIGEYFVLEYRNKSKLFDQYIPNSGLVIYRINPNVNGNADGPPDELYIYRPNGTNTVNGNVSTGYFSSQAGRTSFSDATNPAAFLTNNANGLDGISITSIGASGGNTISFTVNFPNSAAPIALPATNLGRTSFQANWTASSGATNYRLNLFYYTPDSSRVYVLRNSSTGNNTDYTVNGLDRNLATDWHYYVKAESGGIVSQDSSNIIMVELPEFDQIVCENRSNIAETETLTRFLINGTENAFGHNSLVRDKYAEYYNIGSSSNEKVMKGVQMTFGIDSTNITDGNGDSQLAIKIWTVANGLPEAEYYSETFDFKQIKKNGGVANFASEVILPDKFFIGVQIYFTSPRYDFYLYSSPSRGTNGNNTAYVYVTNQWYPILERHSVAISFAISPVICDMLPIAAMKTDTLERTCERLGIQFTAQAKGNVHSWLWNFGDGETSALQKPTHTYLQAGTHQAQLTVKNNFGTATLWSEQFTVYPPLEVTASQVNDDEIHLYISGGNGNYTIVWEDAPTLNTAIRTGLSSGTYRATVTDSEGCSTQIKETLVTVQSTSHAANYKLYPNPAKGEFTIETEKAWHVRIFSLTGILMYEQPIVGTATLPISTLKAGAYVVKMVDDTGNADNQILIVE
ncbi:MAG: M6 family metalloprotease domain-containing protein [Prevotellaceae bacterium]|jgi:M6 family metalloprotease-like protein|nr:M6 family metalloprotease domain-containing protein [Prevotellaceae bacterium]